MTVPTTLPAAEQVGAQALPRLSRAAGDAGPAAPVRIVHLGLGNFFRAHQAWYTDQAPDGADWGIAAFTGRSVQLAQALTGQDGLYTLITRGPDGGSCRVIGSVADAHAGSDQAAWLAYLARPEVVIVTLTVTEAGYVRGPDGGLDVERVADDLAALRRDPSAAVQTVPARLVAGFAARRAAAAGEITVVSCDNLPDNGAVAARVVGEFAGLLDPDLAGWVGQHVSFVTTMVDRITPASAAEDSRAVADQTHRTDAAPVVTEPFSEWVLSGDFPGGRPAWDAAGARFVGDIGPFEQRKLWLLNGGHSLLAYAGSARGHQTIAEAVVDPVCLEWLQQWWTEASVHLTLPADEVAGYRDALLERFGNPRIKHLLAQIASDGSQKMPVRVLPVVRAERAAGRLPLGALRVLAAWINHLRGAGAPVKDGNADALAPLAQGPLEDAVPRVLQYLDAELAADSAVVTAVADLCRSLEPAPQ